MTNRVCTYFLLFMASAWSAEAAEVRLRSSANCPATVVRLADVAEIVADDPAVADELSSIALFPAPPAGSTRQLNRHQVRQLLVISGIELKDISISGSETVDVQSEAARPVVRPGKRGNPANSTIRVASLEEELTAAKSSPAKAPNPVDAAPMPNLVERGQSVTVHSRAAGVRITTSGKAMSQGAMGEEITVELADSRFKVQGRIAGPQTVEVSAAKP